jgi:hypothetical protein
VWSVFAIGLMFLLLAAPAAMADDNTGNIIGGGITCCGALIGLCIAGAIAYWVYTDAESRGANGILWAVIAVLGPCFSGLIAYFIMRPEKKGP